MAPQKFFETIWVSKNRRFSEPPQILPNSTFVAPYSHALLSIRFRKKEKIREFPELTTRTNHARLSRASGLVSLRNNLP